MEDSISIVSSDFMEFKFYFKNGNYHVSLENLENSKKFFDERCDIFIKGDLILHLRKAIKKYKTNKCKVILSRWYPKTHNRFGTGLVAYPFITTYIERINSIGMVSFKVQLSYCLSHTFTVKLSEVEKILENK